MLTAVENEQPKFDPNLECQFPFSSLIILILHPYNTPVINTTHTVWYSPSVCKWSWLLMFLTSSHQGIHRIGRLYQFPSAWHQPLDVGTYISQRPQRNNLCHRLRKNFLSYSNKCIALQGVCLKIAWLEICFQP